MQNKVSIKLINNELHVNQFVTSTDVLLFRKKKTTQHQGNTVL